MRRTMREVYVEIDDEKTLVCARTDALPQPAALSWAGRLSGLRALLGQLPLAHSGERAVLNGFVFMNGDGVLERGGTCDVRPGV